MRDQGTGLGTGGFILYDDRDDPVAIAAGVSRFLAVESCGQCTPCKQDGMALSDRLHRITRSEADDEDLEAIDALLRTVSDSARCNLAYQQHDVVDSILGLFQDAFRDHVLDEQLPADPELIAPIVDIVDGRAVVDERQRAKQPDWNLRRRVLGEDPRRPPRRSPGPRAALSRTGGLAVSSARNRSRWRHRRSGNTTRTG